MNDAMNDMIEPRGCGQDCPSRDAAGSREPAPPADGLHEQWFVACTERELPRDKPL
ncbi:aromatic ring-hydroxylating dioxygenase subunit alpha, partial [Pseudomonas sp. MWU12-2534b]